MVSNSNFYSSHAAITTAVTSTGSVDGSDATRQPKYSLKKFHPQSTDHRRHQQQRLLSSPRISFPPQHHRSSAMTSNASRMQDMSTLTNGVSSSSSVHHGQEQPNGLHSPSQSLAEVCADLHTRIQGFLAAEPTSDVMRRTQEQTKTALDVTEQALRDFDFESLSFSYNGGKDCLVLLILYLAVLHTHFTSPQGRRKETSSQDTNPAAESSFPTRIESVYAKPPDPFPAVTDFVESSSAYYHLDLDHISTNPTPRKPSLSQTTQHSTSCTCHPANTTDTTTTTPSQRVTFRDAFEIYLTRHPQVKAIFVGTRRTDPHGAHLTHFDITDGNWPLFMRIHPIIDWKLSEIWHFLRSPHLGDPRTGKLLEYCPLYDMGYTSLGGIHDTVENPKLKVVKETSNGVGGEVDGGQEEVVVRFRPAYELSEDLEERLGRE